MGFTYVRVVSLHRYPIKSCAGTALENVRVRSQGLDGDRRWMVVDAQTGRFLSQREYPQMARVVPTLTDDQLTIEAPEMPTLSLDLNSGSEESQRPVTVAATVWKFDGLADDAGDHAAAWFSDVLQTPCRLVRAGAAWDRPVNPSHARTGDRVGFADGYPVLLASMASLRDLNQRLSEPVPMDRFRANIVIDEGADALPPWIEDSWTCLTQTVTGSDATAAAVSFRVAKPCARCAMTTIDQTTASTHGPEPLQTLSGFRRDADGKVLFAVNLIPDVDAQHTGAAVLRVGDWLQAETTCSPP